MVRFYKEQKINSIEILDNRINSLEKEIDKINKCNRDIEDKIRTITSSKYYLLWQKFNKIKKYIIKKIY